MTAHTPRNVEPPQPEAPEWIGRIVDDRYKVLEHLGEGGMGAVYVAEHLKLRKEVALKVIHPEFAGDGELAARFAREAMASAKLEHPHVASALDYGTLPEGGAYLVMQLVRGKSVHDLLEEHGALPFAQACEIASQVADALAAAHAEGIVHRDLKPDNVLLKERPDGSIEVKVLDFGIARVAVEEGRKAPEGAAPGKALTRVGTVMGTPGYMSPEQAMGEKVDARADIYALGVVLWEMIVGRDMFGTRDLTTIVTRQLTEPAPPLAANAPSPIPPELDDLVASLLAGRAPNRPSNAAVIRDTLRQIAFGGAAPVSGSHALPPVRERSEATARTMLAKTPPPTGPGVPVMPVHTRPGATPQLPEVVVQKAGDFLRKVHPKWVAAGCGGLFVLGMMLTIAVASIGGDDEPGATESEGDEGGISLTETFQELVPIARPEPSIPPEVQERIDVVLHEGERRERLRAAEWLLEHEPAADVPEFGRVAAELELARGCRGKKPIVERIREQGLVGTLPALERLDGSRRGCGFFGRADCYRCMRRELSETIDALRGEEPPPEEP